MSHILQLQNVCHSKFSLQIGKLNVIFYIIVGASLEGVVVATKQYMLGTLRTKVATFQNEAYFQHTSTDDLRHYS